METTTTAVSPAITSPSAATNRKPAEVMDVPFVTIDSESTRDIDDALHVERSADGCYRIRIAIADPTNLVAIDSTEDVQARLIAATAYVRDKIVRRMLPGLISEYEGSLVAGKIRRALVFDVRLSSNLEVTEFVAQPGLTKVAHRLSYTEIPAIVKNTEHPANGMLSTATTLAMLMLQARRNRGALALYDLSRLLLTDEEGNVRIFHSVEEVVGQILIQEMMILVNHLAARYLVENDVPCIMRNHEPRLAAPLVANDLATTIEGWIAGASFDAEAVRTQFAAIAGKAAYGTTAKGHYGLSLPFYTHISSPLRRYPDLVNMRQMVAHLRKKSLPYTQDELAKIAEDINEALERRKEERSEGFKAVVQRTAEKAIEKGTLAKLADHELRQAVKLSREAGYLPQPLLEEIIERLHRANISDNLVDTLMTEVPLELLTEDLRMALAGWLGEQPPKAMHMLMHAQQTGFISQLNIQAGEDGERGFNAIAKITCADGRSISAGGHGDKKRSAEQAAAVAAIHQIMELPTTQQPEQVAGGTAGVNFKGRLLELCQQRKWSMPTFESSGKGPSHSMIFTATARLAAGGNEYQATASGANSKKEAEMFASKFLLEQLQQGKEAPEEPRAMAAAPTSSSNPVGALQEYAQQNRKAMPTYEIRETSKTPSSFLCTVSFDFGTSLIVEGRGATKQAAKANAAAAGLAILVKKSIN